MFFTPTAAAAKVSDCDHLKEQRAVLPPLHTNPVPGKHFTANVPVSAMLLPTKIIHFRHHWSDFMVLLLINDLAVLQNKNLLGAETEAQH